MKILAKLLAKRAHMPVTNSQQIQNCPRHAMKVQAAGGKMSFRMLPAAVARSLDGKIKGRPFFFLNKRKFNEDARYTICLFVHKHLKLVILNKNNLFFFLRRFLFCNVAFARTNQIASMHRMLREAVAIFNFQWTRAWLNHFFF